MSEVGSQSVVSLRSLRIPGSTWDRQPPATEKPSGSITVIPAPERRDQAEAGRDWFRASSPGSTYDNQGGFRKEDRTRGWLIDVYA